MIYWTKLVKAKINADIMHRSNDENFEQCFDITNQKGEVSKNLFLYIYI